MDENTIIKLLNAFPDKPWCWDTLSINPNIQSEFIQSINKYAMGLV
jgi:hypothetical protein